MPSAAALRLVELRQVSSRALELLFAEEQQHWREQLYWDYRPSLQLIRRFIDGHSLAGYVALADGRAAGYGFYVIEDHKGLIGDLFVSPQYELATVCGPLLHELVSAIRQSPGVARIEAQLMPLGSALNAELAAQGFRLYSRQFMHLPLSGRAAPPEWPAGLRLENWDPRHVEPCARLIRLAYANHLDSEINDQYCSESGALRFLRNITLLPGCGRFLPEASFVVYAPDRQMIGAVTNSEVSEGVAHTTQICVAPDYQRQGLGRRLMEVAMATLAARRFRALTLTVTSLNAAAVQLYEQLGFRTVHTFAAAVWRAPVAGPLGSRQ